jgi:hypothetical protein
MDGHVASVACAPADSASMPVKVGEDRTTVDRSIVDYSPLNERDRRQAIEWRWRRSRLGSRLRQEGRRALFVA